jgi:Tfp pilus assembly protein PilV
MQAQKGFSFIEIMLSMLLLTTGLLAMAHSVTVAVGANYRTKQETLAAAYAQQKVEYLKTVDFTHSDLAAGTRSDTPAMGFTRTWTVTTSGTEKTVTLTVTRSINNSNTPVQITVVFVRSQ